MRKGIEIELKVGFFVTLGLALIMLSILVLGNTEGLLIRKNHYSARFPSVEGLIQGAKVVIGGVQVGTVEKLDFDPEHRDIRATFQIARAQADWIRGDSVVEIQTQGVLGDKYLMVSRGADDQPEIKPDSELPTRIGESLTQFISKSDQLMATLQSLASGMDRMIKTFESGRRSEIFFQGMATTAKNLADTSTKLNQEVTDLQLKTVSKNLNRILEKVNNGTGTLGSLVNDPSLYDDMKSLMGGANRNRVVRNLVRQTIRKNDQAEADAEAAEKKKKK
ncbi:MlaD family protein [Bdellovibrionota bacterium FG-1]